MLDEIKALRQAMAVAKLLGALPERVSMPYPQHENVMEAMKFLTEAMETIDPSTARTIAGENTDMALAMLEAHEGFPEDYEDHDVGALANYLSLMHSVFQGAYLVSGLVEKVNALHKRIEELEAQAPRRSPLPAPPPDMPGGSSIN